jgi:hypothetical protein
MGAKPATLCPIEPIRQPGSTRRASWQCPFLAVSQDLKVRSHGELRVVTVTSALSMLSTDLLPLVVPIALLIVAIRRNTGVLAAILLLVLFIVAV